MVRRIYILMSALNGVRQRALPETTENDELVTLLKFQLAG